MEIALKSRYDDPEPNRNIVVLYRDGDTQEVRAVLSHRTRYEYAYITHYNHQNIIGWAYVEDMVAVLNSEMGWGQI